MRSSSRRFLAGSGALILVAGLVGCGGGGGGSTPTSSTNTGPSQSRITVTATAPTVTFSSRSGFTYRVATTATLTEAAGLGANINYARRRFLFAGVEIERQEISSADLILQTGSNRLGASSSRNLNLIFDTNAEQATSALLVFNFTDDRGNNQEASFTITF
jgi:hypothetical protein